MRADRVFWWLLTLSMVVLGAIAGVVYVEEVQAEPHIGQDYLALTHKDFKLESNLPLGTAGGMLDWTFGENDGQVFEFLKTVRPKYFRIHLLNTVCVRNGNCGPYEIGARYTIQSFNAAVLARNTEILGWVKARTLLYKNQCAKFPEVTCLISPALEHNLSREAWRILADAVLQTWCDVRLVNSPMALPAERYRGAWLEAHGPSASASVDISSLDGIDAADISIGPWLKRFKHTKILYVWSRGYNCRNQGPFEDPRTRTSCPTRPTFELLTHITDRRGPAPRLTIPCRVHSFTRPNIWKPLSEDKGTGDRRANLPVAITTFGKTRIEVVGHDGSSKGYLGFYGAYKGRQNRHYSGEIGSAKSGYEFSKGWAWLKQGNTCLGPFIPGRRQGTYR